MSDVESELKRSARRRLIGAVALALATIVALPMLFDREPPPLGDRVEIIIPSQNTPFQPVPQGAAVTQPGSDASVSAAKDVAPPSAPRPTVVNPATDETLTPSGNAAKPAVPVGSDATSKAGAYFLQLGTFTTSKNAQALAQRVAKAGFKVMTVEVDGRYKVRVGPASSKAIAQALQRELSNKDFTSVIVNP